MSRPPASRILAVLISAVLVFSVAQVSYSAGKINGSKIAKRSIPGKAIKKGAITAKEIKKDAVTATEIKESTLPFAAKAVESVHVVGAAGQIPFVSGWQVGGTDDEERPGFWKDQTGMVHLHGAITRAIGTEFTMFTLPPGYRPNLEQFFITYGSGATPAYLWIKPDGSVNLVDGNANYIGLGNITFRAK